MNPYSNLSEKERIEKIGELLATAAIRFLRDQPPETRPPRSEPFAPKVVQVWDLVDDEIEKRVLRYLFANLAAQPVQMAQALNVQYRTLARRLERLRAVGLLTVSGKTKGAQYSLAAPSDRN